MNFVLLFYYTAMNMSSNWTEKIYSEMFLSCLMKSIFGYFDLYAIQAPPLLNFGPLPEIDFFDV